MGILCGGQTKSADIFFSVQYQYKKYEIQKKHIHNKEFAGDFVCGGRTKSADVQFWKDFLAKVSWGRSSGASYCPFKIIAHGLQTQKYYTLYIVREPPKYYSADFFR